MTRRFAIVTFPLINKETTLESTSPLVEVICQHGSMCLWQTKSGVYYEHFSEVAQPLSGFSVSAQQTSDALLFNVLYAFVGFQVTDDASQ